ncbi:MAG: TerC family protein [Planctomycetota bacterium JB042]
MIENILTLGMLVLLQAVLGFDNLLYISLESKRAPKSERARVRRLGIGLAIVLRIVLLFVLVRLVDAFQEPMFAIDTHAVHGSFNLHALIVLAGGAFILYTAVKEVFHMITLDTEAEEAEQEAASVAKIVFWIVLMNLVFSFDSILSAMALTDVFWVMATAIVIGGLLMIWLADRVSSFLQKNRMYEVLGLFILLLVGVMLISEGGHLAHLSFFGHEITPMTKATFYFVLAVLVLTDLVQGRYQKKLLKRRELLARREASGA